MAIKKEDEKKKKLKYQYDRDHEIVTGLFRNYEVPGGSLSFSYKKWKKDPVEKYTMIDGEKYKIPRMIAEHLNTNIAYPVHEFNMSTQGAPSMRVGRMVRRCGFQSLEFTGIPSLDGPVIEQCVEMQKDIITP